MTDYTELLRLAEKVIAEEDMFSSAPQPLHAVTCDPQTIIGLIRENERLREHCKQALTDIGQLVERVQTARKEGWDLAISAAVMAVGRIDRFNSDDYCDARCDAAHTINAIPYPPPNRSRSHDPR